MKLFNLSLYVFLRLLRIFMFCNLFTNLLTYENTNTFLKFSYLRCQHDTLDASNIRYANKTVGKMVFSF